MSTSQGVDGANIGECRKGSMAKDVQDIVILDGGFSSQLSKHTTAKVDGDPLWSARFLSDDPKAVVRTHLDFVRAGSQVITTNTFQASVGGFMKYLDVTEEKALQLITDGVSYAKEAIHLYENELPPAEHGKGKKILIAGSVGPYGACLSDGSEYRGDYIEKMSEEELENWHRPRISTLVRAGVDLLAFETIPAVEEARVLVRMLVQEFPGQKAWLSFSSQDGEKTAHGDDFLSAVQECWALGKGQLVAIGVNCVKPSHATSLCKIVRAGDGPAIPLIVYPNSGENWDHDKGWLDKHLCEPAKAFVREWIDLEVSYIGGCCRISAEDVSDIKNEVDDYLRKKANV